MTERISPRRHGATEETPRPLAGEGGAPAPGEGRGDLTAETLFEWIDYDPHDDFDDDEIDEDECRMMSDGQCLLAGSEWCDWECPRGGL
jgi:hypothetical protein